MVYMTAVYITDAVIVVGMRLAYCAAVYSVDVIFSILGKVKIGKIKIAHNKATALKYSDMREHPTSG